ncbi:MAG: outer membrane protein assembly factor BamA [Candidatus Tectomicrobia bacterium]|uniref:Outer membrane protein assembly factor BamA n=1 Tax=Tectimicrobiota bacterium TaxID=2528274 RepID=A0A933E9M1_UNCTE|nr:outer membrane protein assembly factor BamA [Candidatus Tectomicrobia bacterium]
MHRAAKVVVCAATVTALSVFTCLASLAQAPSPAITVRSIEIRGNRRVDRSTVMFYLKLGEGKAYTNTELVQRIREDVRTIYGLGFFRDVRVDVEPFEGGLRVVFHVAEKPTIASVGIQGNVNVDSEKVRERITVKAQTIVNEATIKESVRNLHKLYQEQGYYFARIEATLKEGSQNTVALAFLIDEGESVRIETITFRGSESISRRDVLSSMETSEWGIFSFLTGSGIFREDELQKDLVRIRVLYESRGFLNVQVGQPIIREDRQRGWLNITIPVSEGFVYKVGKIELRGGEDVVPPEELRGKMELFPGDVFNRTLLLRDVQRISGAFAERGYAFADVRPSTKINEQQKTADVVLDIGKGQRVFIGRIDLKGNTRTRENVIRREVRITEGSLYDAAGLAKTRTRLQRTGYFEEIKIHERRRPGVDEILDIEIEVKEKPTGVVALGLGYNSQEAGLVTAQVREDNLFGKGWVASLVGRLSGLRRDVIASFVEPDFRDLGFSLGGDAFFGTEEFDTFDNRREGGRIRVGKEIQDFLRVFLTYELATSRISRVSETAALFIQEEAGRDIVESAITPSLVYDSRNLRFFPSAGTLFTVAPSLFGTFLGGNVDLYLAEMDFRQYHSIGDRVRIRLLKDLITSYRVNLRYEEGISGDEVPAFRRLFVSGNHQLRGFRARDIGPRDANGEVIGGLASALFSFELAHPFIGPTQLAAFIDAGNIWGTSNAFDLSDLRYGAGFGLRFITPIGPIRIDIGYKIDKKSGERPRELHFGVGAAF